MSVQGMMSMILGERPFKRDGRQKEVSVFGRLAKHLSLARGLTLREVEKSSLRRPFGQLFNW